VACPGAIAALVPQLVPDDRSFIVQGLLCQPYELLEFKPETEFKYLKLDTKALGQFKL